MRACWPASHWLSSLLPVRGGGACAAGLEACSPQSIASVPRQAELADCRSRKMQVALGKGESCMVFFAGRPRF